MQPVHASDVDLNLLVALRALLHERHVTRAAARVGLSQPAMSHALARLRELTGDPILVRTPRGMQPTPRAEAMAGPLEQALSEIHRLLAAPGAFDPGTSTRRFHIGASDYVELAILPGVLTRVWAEAPGVDVRVVNLPMTPTEDLAEGRLDLGIGLLPQFGSPPPSGIRAQKVIEDRFVCVVREGHPTVKKRLELDSFCELPHALVAPRGQGGGIVDTALAKLGRQRRVALQVAHFLVAPHIVRETDLVLTLATRMADVLAPMLGLRRLPPPVELGGFSMWMAWHERQQADPAHAWLRAVVAQTTREGRRGRKPT